MEFICTCSSIVNWKIKLILQKRLLHKSISVEATGKYYTYNLSGAPNENVVQNHLNIELLNVF